jgi:hypothetical protein
LKICNPLFSYPLILPKAVETIGFWAIKLFTMKRKIIKISKNFAINEKIIYKDTIYYFKISIKIGLNQLFFLEYETI